MNRSFPLAMTRGFDHLVADMPADRPDQGILAAAVYAGANALVTENRKHFWPGMLESNTLLCVNTSDFLRSALLRDPDWTVRLLNQMVAGNRRPPHTFSDYLDRLVQIQELSVFARALNAAVPETMRGCDPRLQRPAVEAKASTKALAGLIPVSDGLAYERRRSSRYPQARQWASGRRPRNSGVEK